MIKFLKIITGEDIIADVIEEEIGTDPLVTLKNPAMLLMSREGMAMVPYAPFVKGDSVKLATSRIIYEGELDDEILKAYNERFGSGIVVPPTPKLELFGL